MKKIKSSRIENYPLYEVLSDGTILGLRGKILKPHPTGTNKGYRAVRLYNSEGTKWFLVHRLVAMCFIENPENKPQVNHKDGDKLNNNVSNLEWATRSENMQHAYDSGLMPYTEKQRAARIQNCKNMSIPVLDTATGIYYDSITEAALTIGKKSNYLSRCLSGVRKNKTNFIYAN
jgi:hypothetical protein